MRAIFEPPFALGHTPIREITLDPRSRDDIPAVLRGLQDRFTHRSTRGRCSRSCGSTWARRSICGVVARACVYGGSSCWAPCRRRSPAISTAWWNGRTITRRCAGCLGHADFGDKHPYRLQTVIDHVRLLTEAALQKINAVVARGHQLLKHIRIRFAAGPIQRWQRPLCTGLRMSACCGMRCAA